MSQSSNGQTTPIVVTQPDQESADSLEELALDYLSALVDVPRSLLSRDSDVTTLGLSSAQVMELVYKVEDELGIVLTDGDLAAIASVSELVELALKVARSSTAGPS